MAKKRLGRGLDALLGQSSRNNGKADIDAGFLKTVKIELLRPGQYQPRRRFDQDKLQELADSIKSQGLIQPVLVRPSPGGFFEILAGERRVRAAKLAELNYVSVIVEEVSDKKAMSLALIENIQREDLNAIEEATALDRLVKEFEMSHDDVAQSVGRSRASVSNLIRLLGLPASVKTMVAQNLLEMGHARALIGKTPDDFDENILNQIGKGKLSVRDLEKKKRKVSKTEPNLVNEEMNLSSTIGFKTKITYSSKGKGNIKIFYENIEQYNFLIKKLKN